MSVSTNQLASTNNDGSAARRDAAIVCSGLTKQYKLGQHRSLKGTVGRLRGRTETSILSAIDDVSLTVAAGDCVGLVGGNGSGKSTLLQVLSGITVPTAGHAEIRGSVLPLLAVGTGFHPELTGRENIVLFGTVLGFPRSDGERQVDEVADFAEIVRHIDTPIKRYSDGMRSRLSFAIAMRFPADIYIFDEVLAIADEEFRSRCVVEIARLAASDRTVLFVSHDSTLVERLCQTTVWLDQGRVRMAGATAEILPEYRRRSRGTGR